MTCSLPLWSTSVICVCDSGTAAVTGNVGGRQFLSMLGKKAKELPARPEIPKAHFDADKLDSRYVELKLSGPDGPAFLDKNVKIEPPKDKKKPTYSDLLRGVSEAIGYSIVAEGCAARNVRVMAITDSEKLPTMFGHETSVREILKFAQDVHLTTRTGM